MYELKESMRLISEDIGNEENKQKKREGHKKRGVSLHELFKDNSLHIRKAKKMSLSKELLKQMEQQCLSRGGVTSTFGMNRGGWDRDREEDRGGDRHGDFLCV